MDDHPKPIVIEPRPEDFCFQAASVDLTLGNEFQMYNAFGGDLDPVAPPKLRIIYVKDGCRYFLEPSRFVLAATRERIAVPDDLVARVEGKSSLGRLGLLVHVTAGFIDPGYRGVITLELRNLNMRPIVLRPGMRISQLCFESMTSKAGRPYGSDGLCSKYQDSETVVSARPDTVAELHI